MLYPYFSIRFHIYMYKREINALFFVPTHIQKHIMPISTQKPKIYRFYAPKPPP